MAIVDSTSSCSSTPRDLEREITDLVQIADFVEDFATEYFGRKANVIDLCGAGAAHAESQINHLLFGLRKISAMAGALQDALAD
jgi:hypothetical protein